MTRFEAIAISFRPGQVRLDDVVRQVGDAKKFIVRVLDTFGRDRELHLELAEKWGGSWRWELRCPSCGGPARLLHVVGDGALCSKCDPQLTAQQRHKRAAWWTAEGAIADELVRTVLAGTSSTKRKRKLLNKLKFNTVTRAAHLIERADTILRTVDALRAELR